MSRTGGTARAATESRSRALLAWSDALGAVAAGMVTMWAVATLGLWAAGAGSLPGDSFPRIVAAVVVIAVGGSLGLNGDAGFLGRVDAELEGVPLSVTLAGALVTGCAFLMPLRLRAVVDAREIASRVARTAVVWLVALLLLCLVARHTLRVSLGGGIVEEVGQALDTVPTATFRAEIIPTLGFGLLWLLALLAVALLLSRAVRVAPGLRGVQRSVRPLAYAMLLVLLSSAAIGLITGLVVLIAEPHRSGTLAVLLLALPNLAWTGFGIGIGGAWDGHVSRGVGLPMPPVLTDVLRTPGHRDATLDLGSVAEHDGRAWLLAAVAAVLLLVAGYVAAARSPGPVRPWRHAVRLAVALVLTLLVVGLLTRVSAGFGLTLIGVGDLGDGVGGGAVLRPDFLRLLGFGALWGLVAGFLGSLLDTAVRRRRGGVTAPGTSGDSGPSRNSGPSGGSKAQGDSGSSADSNAPGRPEPPAPGEPRRP